MPYDPAVIEEYLNELGLSDAVRTTVLGELKTNERAATQFVGQRLRHSDYTKKAQGLATDRAALEASANTQIGKYAEELAKAEQRIATIMLDFEKESISKTTAEARLRGVKEKFNLSDEDIPTVSTPAAARVEPTPAIDIDAKLAAFGKAIVAEMRQEMSRVPDLNAIQYDIARQHQDLLGKPLTAAEVKELNKEGAKHRDGLLGAWKEKYEIDNLQREKDYTARLATDRQKWEDEQRTQRSNDAMSAATNKDPVFSASSAVLKRSFERRDGITTDPAQSTDKSNPAPNTPLTAIDRNKVSGAERAAAKWIERAQNGQLGKPVAA